MTIHRAAWVLPMHGAVIENGAVGVEGDRITYVGPAAGAPRGATLDLGDAALMPGLVNVHTHLELTPLRHLLEGLDFAQWIRTLTTLRRTHLTDVADIECGARVGIAEGLLRGITTFADTSDTAGPVVTAMHAMGVRGVVYKEVFGPDPQQCDASLASLRDAVHELRRHESPGVRIGVSPHAPYSVSKALFAATANFALADALPMAVHLAESEFEEALVVRGDGPYADNWRSRGIDPAGARARSSVALLHDAGALRARPLIIHAVRIDAADIALLAASGCTIAHCPVSNARFGHGIAPLQAMLDAGLVVGIGTDSVASNNRMDLLDEARVAHLMACMKTSSWRAFPSASALRHCTMGGAAALGLWPQLGQLTVGAPADLCAFPLDGYAARPLVDVCDALVHGVAGSPARLTVACGVVKVRDGALVDAAACAADLARFATISESLVTARRRMMS
ncbi:MAG TPA: amidohydrolase family protein [Gemmatimonadaceae bacterium]|nr:amidohydrolase family protein [Gemmatimonadaceae bacterium]